MGGNIRVIDLSWNHLSEVEFEKKIFFKPKPADEE
jgi:hypothetical protein